MQRYEPALIRAHAKQIYNLMGRISTCSDTRKYQKRLSAVLDALSVMHDLASSALMGEMLAHGCGDECFEVLAPVGTKTIGDSKQSEKELRKIQENIESGALRIS